MNYFYGDASAVGKRYAPEVGTPLMNYLFDTVSHNHLVMLTQAIGETLSIVVRRRNAGTLSATAYQQASQALRTELIVAGDVQLQSTTDALVLASLPLIEKHAINSTDALVLCSALEVAATLCAAGHDLVLVAADIRLLRAAQAEGLATFNPERDTQSQLDVLIAG
ncbi:type II toxin-antitoxin system VapC family toxin [Candidatus Poribacteria bacterium]|nr:type II toxin-antitoxin system VapC family toxin [Candidatus Poribacteria bacterium]